VGKRILIIKPSSLGDIANAMAVVPQLRLLFPDSTLEWLANEEYAGLVEHAGVDRVVTFDRGSWRRMSGVAQGVRSFTRLCWFLRKRQYDIVLELQGLLRSGWFAWVTRAPVRIGFADARECSSFFYTERVIISNPETHAVDRYLATLKKLGDVQTPGYWRWSGLDECTRQLHERLESRKGDYFVLVPGTRWEIKKWPEPAHARLAAELHRRYGSTVYISGTRDEKALVESVASDACQQFGAEAGIVPLAGVLNLKELAVFCRDSRMVIAGDTGPMHLTVATGGCVLALMGPTLRHQHGPYNQPDNVLSVDMPCVPCRKKHCHDGSTPCMSKITVEMVLGTIETLLDKPGT